MPEHYRTATRQKGLPLWLDARFGAQHKDLGTVSVARASSEVLPQLGQLLEAS